MKRCIFILCISLLILGCQREEKLPDVGGRGWLSVEFLIDKTVQTKAEQPIYSLDICKLDGSVVSSYPDCSVLTERILLKAGDYKLVAHNGKDTSAAFEMPYYRAEQDVKIEPGVSKSISMICTQANVKVSTEFSKAIEDNFPIYSLLVTNEIDTLVFEKGEKRAGYFNINEGVLRWELTLNNGQEEFKVSKTIVDVKARQYYKFNFDIKADGNVEDGAFVPSIKVDTTTNIVISDYDIILKDPILKPTIKREDGLPMKDPVLVLNDTRGANVKVNVVSGAQIQELNIRHQSDKIVEMGIPKTVAFTRLNPELTAAINNAGIVWGNSPILNAKSVAFDFSALANKLPLGDYEFYFQVYDASNRLLEDTLRINVIPDIDHIADEVNIMDVWAKFATIRGRWYTIEQPTDFALEYSTDQTQWTPVSNPHVDVANKTIIGSLTNLQPNTTYYFRTTGGGKGASTTIRSFTTERADQLPWMNFDAWYMDGKAPMVGVSGEPIVWDSGNKGGALFGYIPTTEETGVVVRGSAAKLASVNAVVKFAAGNLYTGKFVELSGTNVLLDFGVAYTCRPTTLSGYYKYQPGKIDKIKEPYNHLKGQTDSCHIYIALTDWDVPFRADSKNLTYVDLKDPAIIALGELKTDKAINGSEANGYEKFTIKLNYRDKTRKPKHILIVATASKYGDYFTGSTKSVLWIDEFELGFDSLVE